MLPGLDCRGQDQEQKRCLTAYLSRVRRRELAGNKLVGVIKMSRRERAQLHMYSKGPIQFQGVARSNGKQMQQNPSAHQPPRLAVGLPCRSSQN